MRAIIKKFVIYLSENNPMVKRFYENSSFIRTPVGLSIINFFCQRILRINSGTSIPVNFTSRVMLYSNIKHHNDRSTKLSFSVSGGTYIQATNGIELGKNFLFAPGVKLISSNHDKREKEKAQYSPPIVIGDNVWLGTNVVILPGVQIGNNCTVGAGSIVTKNFIEDNSVIVGNPARLIGSIKLKP